MLSEMVLIQSGFNRVWWNHAMFTPHNQSALVNGKLCETMCKAGPSLKKQRTRIRKERCCLFGDFLLCCCLFCLLIECWMFPPLLHGFSSSQWSHAIPCSLIGCRFTSQQPHIFSMIDICLTWDASLSSLRLMIEYGAVSAGLLPTCCWSRAFVCELGELQIAKCKGGCLFSLIAKLSYWPSACSFILGLQAWGSY